MQTRTKKKGKKYGCSMGVPIQFVLFKVWV
nr:MAG TPA: hypothetical protein [Caudoviricetes sp.]